MSARADTLPRSLLAGVLLMTLVVLGLGGAVVALKLRPQPIPTDSVNREIALWKDAVDATPNDANAHPGLGLASLRAQQTDDARSEFEKAIQLNDTSWMAEFQLALIVKADDPTRAEDLLNQAVRDASAQDRQAPLVALGDLLLAQGDLQGAVKAYKKSIGIDPFTFDAHFGLGSALEKLGQNGPALKEYKEAQRFDPTNQEVADAIDRVTNG